MLSLGYLLGSYSFPVTFSSVRSFVCGGRGKGEEVTKDVSSWGGCGVEEGLAMRFVVPAMCSSNIVSYDRRFFFVHSFVFLRGTSLCLSVIRPLLLGFVGGLYLSPSAFVAFRFCGLRGLSYLVSGSSGVGSGVGYQYGLSLGYLWQGVGPRRRRYFRSIWRVY